MISLDALLLESPEEAARIAAEHGFKVVEITQTAQPRGPQAGGNLRIIHADFAEDGGLILIASAFAPPVAEGESID